MTTAGLIATLAACTSDGNGTDTSAATSTQIPAATATAAEPVRDTVLGIITDYGNCDKGEQQVADMVGTWKVQAIATVGDNTQQYVGCTPYTDSVGRYYGSYVTGPDGPRFFPVPGNHDYTNPGAGVNAYLAYFSFLSALTDHPLWYQMSIGDVNLFMIDSEASTSDMQQQKTWLQGALADARAKAPNAWNLVLFHRPPFTSGPHEPDTAMRPDAGWDYAKWGADLVVNGHQHVYEELKVDGFPYIVAGVGASLIERACPAKLVPQSQGCTAGDGAILLKAGTDSLELQYRQPDGKQGKVLKTFELTRH